MTAPQPDPAPSTKPGLFAALRRIAGHLYTTTTARGRGRLIIQAIGTIVALALLAWVVSMAVSNRDLLVRLLDAPLYLLLLLFGLSILSLFLNGLSFWITLRPIKIIPLLDMLAANCVASAVALIPGKLSVIWRVLVHNRRDHIPVLTIGSYLIANGVIVLAVAVPLGLVGLWRKGADLTYALASLGGVAICAGLAFAFARLFAHERGLARLQAIAAFFRIGILDRALASSPFAKLHRALAILAHTPTLTSAIAVRTLDLLVQSARFTVAAAALGLTVSYDKAVLAGTTYFLIGVASPTGALGSSEGGTTGLAAITDISGLSTHDFAVITLAVGLSQMLVWLTAATFSIIYLRPNRWVGPTT